MGSRLTVGLQILALPVGVRIPTPQHNNLVGQEVLLPYFVLTEYLLWPGQLQNAAVG